jgi:hypothetical protein
VERHELETVVYEKDGPVARIVLNRPEKANAQNSAMVWDVDNSLMDAEADYAIKVVILKANGPGFCAGHDVASARTFREFAQAREVGPLSVLMAIKAGVKRAWETMGMRVHVQSQFHLMWPVGDAGDVAAWRQENVAKGYGTHPREVAAKRAEIAVRNAAGGKDKI